MKISEAFPSNYIKAADLQGRNINVTIDRVDMERIGQDDKPVLYFQGKEKGLVLNKTNSTAIAYAYGDDTQDWQGGEIVLYPTSVLYEGRSVDAIRVRIPPRQPARAAAAGSAPAPAARPDLDDDIPF